MTKTEAIINILATDFPLCGMVRASAYRKAESPFDRFRDGIKNYSGITSRRGINFYDPDIDIGQVNKFIKSLRPLEKTC